MIPDSLLALAIFLAGVGPGFVYVEVARRRALRPGRTQLAELAEFLVVGVAHSVAVGSLLLVIGEVSGSIDAGAMLTDTAAYYTDEPVRLLAFLVVALTLSFLAACGTAAVLYRRRGPRAKRGVQFSEDETAWVQALIEDRPSENHLVQVLAELKDGRKVFGTVSGLTAEGEGDRELYLVAPLALQLAKDRKMQVLDENGFRFFVVRESQVNWIAGRYVEPAPSESHASPYV